MNRPFHPSFPSTTSLDRFLQRALSGSPLVSRDHPPREQLKEDEDAYRLTIDLPGLRKEELHLELKERRLTLTVTPTGERPFVATETRSWDLGPQVDSAGLKARLDLGVLHIELPKLKSSISEPLTIEIQ